ncbi:UDP-4-amino-4,6-dideoxy-N-acetyl-beta-L-altrosamine N-acetyltransferase [Neobacillus cucumis]|uniref:UDP-4-amino-4, 6-dideoxy-N-acetyl-beta-L-altrosamine N-acetyltransferase n=1 Tax=Neobacillus cucumis TaxID=1740721 RepID=UPI002E21585B|nr:UDP-4-amino-4,6-dideoxy-N-acetyl-beta-L-altrosamine N-acetyltransferase [Neobacillus cucumis]
MDYELRSLTDEDKDLIFKWRNLEFIRPNMFNDKIIPYEDHCQWFANTLTNHAEHYRVFVKHTQPLGLVSFKKSDSQHLAYFWGFYIGELDAPKGAGSIMGSLALDYAFESLNAKRIIGEVLSTNKKSEAFHRKLGFKQDLRYKNSIYRNGQFITINRFVLDKENWEFHRS